MSSNVQAVPKSWGWDVSLVQAALVGLVAGSLFLTGCDGGGSNGDPDLTAPAAPTGLAAEAGDGEVVLSWDAVSGADTYNVYRSTSSGIDVPGSPLESGIAETSFTDTDAENGTTFFYVVTSVASSGGQEAESGASGESEATPFAPPTNLAGTSGDSQIELTWSTAEGASAYNVYRDTTSMEGAEDDPLETDVSPAAFSDTTAENGTTYFYRVTSINPENLESKPSGEVEKTPFANPPDRP